MGGFVRQANTESVEDAMYACKASENTWKPLADLGPVGANLFAKVIARFMKRCRMHWPLRE